ncbi:hypothetical protein ACE2AJ_07255 [Aquihabitans daechungensis]|uniref:hypothetical protein n=1 Tax=Aquihabitans daechungensis TaxID=1052257 RepID=UPI003BA07B24
MAAVGEWVQVELDQPTELDEVTIRIPATTGRRIGRVRVETDQGSTTGTVGADGSVTIALPAGRTQRLRVTIDDLVGVASVARVGISEIELPGVEIRRPLVVPSPGPGGADVVNLSRSRSDRFSARRDEDGSLDREFRWGGAAQAELHGTASAAPGAGLDALLATDGPPPAGAIEATATSQRGRLPAFAPTAAVDDDPLTAWISQPEAGAPALTLRWEGPVPVDTIGISALRGVADPVTRVVVTADGTSYERPLEPSGNVSIPSTITDELTLSFPDPDDAPDHARQVAIAEVTVPALLGRTADVPDRDASIELACGDGPPVSVDGRAVETRASTKVGALLDGSPIDWTACAPVDLRHGVHRIEASAGSLLVSTLVVEPPAAFLRPRRPAPSPPRGGGERTGPSDSVRARPPSSPPRRTPTTGGRRRSTGRRSTRSRSMGGARGGGSPRRHHRRPSSSATGRQATSGSAWPSPWPPSPRWWRPPSCRTGVGPPAPARRSASGPGRLPSCGASRSWRGCRSVDRWCSWPSRWRWSPTGPGGCPSSRPRP